MNHTEAASIAERVLTLDASLRRIIAEYCRVLSMAPQMCPCERVELENAFGAVMGRTTGTIARSEGDEFGRAVDAMVADLLAR